VFAVLAIVCPITNTDRLKYQSLIKDILNEYAKYKPAFGEIDSRVSFDDEHGTYALLQVGWNGDEYF